MVAKYRSVLAVPGSSRLLASALLGRLPMAMSSLAILLLVRGTTHSYLAAGLAVGAYAFASAAGAPMQGRLVDRFGRLRVLVPSAVAQAWCWSYSCSPARPAQAHPSWSGWRRPRAP